MQNYLKLAKSGGFNKDSVIILCHGFMSDNTKPPIKELSDYFQETYPILPINFGDKSDFPTFSYCLEVLDNAVKFVKEQGFNKIHLIGHSMGASIITIYAATHKDNIGIKSLSCISMSYKANKFDINARYELLPDNKNAQISINGNAFTIPLSFIEDAEKYQVEEYLKQIAQPILFVQGANDRLVQNGEINEMYNWALNENSKIRIIENTGHLFKDHISDLQEEINEFIKLSD